MSEELNKLIEERAEELYNHLMEKPLRVLSIFNDFFGEERVDMQGYPSLEEFRNWLYSTPIYKYTSRAEIGASVSNWSHYNCNSVTNIPEPEVPKVIDNFEAMQNSIGELKFNEIFILVHFPHVRVTNEHDRFVDINHLWAKVRVNYNGTIIGSFTLNRSEYTLLHMISSYMHSHVSSIPTDNFKDFKTPCLGSGPINATISTLCREYDEDMWNMFCLELSKYVTTESISGVPYHYLEKLGTSNMSVGLDSFRAYSSSAYYIDIIPIDKLKDFVRQFVNTKKLKFNYMNGSYSIGMSLPEYITLISNEFISWYNMLYSEGKIKVPFSELKRRRVLNECIIDNGRIYTENNAIDVERHLNYIGKEVCIFKGKRITVSITDISEINNDNKSIILNTQMALYILGIILKVLNYRYGRETNTTEGYQANTEVRYL